MSKVVLRYRDNLKVLISSCNSFKFQISKSIRLNSTTIKKSQSKEHFDLIVIGGGSGGLACAKEAAKYNKSVCVVDFVKKSPIGTEWGLGGTCVNVGCIPKKLFHQAALLGEAIKDSKSFGWNLNETVSHNWQTAVVNIQQHIRQLNWGHRVQLKSKEVVYKNAFASFIDKNRLKLIDKKNKEVEITGEKIVIAVGGRPIYPEIDDARSLCITSDDIFTLQQSPSKTLVIGASYVGLEIAGFLNGLGVDTSLMIRSIPLRGFDQQCASLLVDYLKESGVTVYEKCVPTKFFQDDNDKALKNVLFKYSHGNEHSESFNTILLAVGRYPDTKNLKLENVGVKITQNGKILGNFQNDFEQTSIDNIYAIGDVLQNGIELTPVAIKAGKLLARRLFNNESERLNYENVPTTIFTPLEYSCCGLSEEDAIKKIGVDNIDVYHAFYRPLEFILPDKKYKQCYIKMLINKSNDKVIGLHFIGPNAGEVMQGFSAAINCGATKNHILSTVGIHPTCAEEIIKLNITKFSGLDPTVTEC